MKKLKIKACGHYVIVKPERFEKTTDWGFVEASEGEVVRLDAAATRGHIVSIGDNAWKAFNQGEKESPGKPWAKVGDYVYFKRYVADRIIDENDIVDGKPQEYFLMSDVDILAEIGEEDEE